MRNITVKSSLELTQSQKQTLEKGLKDRYGEDITIEYVIKDILGGLIITDGEKLLDLSMSKDLLKIKKEAERIINEMHAASSAGAQLEKELTPSDIPAFLKFNLGNIVTGNLDIDICGKVIDVADGIIRISGLSSCKYNELLLVNKDTYAIAMNLEKDRVGAMLLNNIDKVSFGDIVYATGKTAEVPVGQALLGRVVNPLGQPLDGIRTLFTEKFRKIESPAPSIVDREKVSRPLSTGILAIDSMVPIGKGQRELIIGDRQTGKTSIAIDTIINQKGKNTLCVYVAIGQRAGEVAKIIRVLKENDAFEYTCMVVSAADDAPSLQYLAPYTGCAIAEEFMYDGKDVLIVYDDLSKHAVAYRTISLLLKRPSGREAYPGDIFYIHSRLLERAAKLCKQKGGGSMTALPIIETLEGDISSYIPTNIISITDGQIYLERELFRSGVRPAVNVGLSVSRVGGAAQYPAIRKLSSKLRLTLAHYRELAVFSHFGSELDDNTKRILDQGEKIVEALKQPQYQPMSVLRQTLILYLIANQLISDVDKKHLGDFLTKFHHFYYSSYPAQAKELNSGRDLSDNAAATIEVACEQFKAYYLASLKKGGLP